MDERTSADPAWPGFDRPDQEVDEAAVDMFAQVMKAKLASSRAKGRGGWQLPSSMPGEGFWEMLREHVDKGDPRDVAIIAMMIWCRSSWGLDDPRRPGAGSAPV